MKCPKCDVELINSEDKLKCPICFGIWRHIKDNKTLKLLSKIINTYVDRQKYGTEGYEEDYRINRIIKSSHDRCPSCHSKLYRIYIENEFIDYCINCNGFWGDNEIKVNNDSINNLINRVCSMNCVITII